MVKASDRDVILCYSPALVVQKYRAQRDQEVLPEPNILKLLICDSFIHFTDALNVEASWKTSVLQKDLSGEAPSFEGQEGS